MNTITSLDNAKVKKYCKLQKKKYRDEYQEFIVEGMHLVQEAYRTGYLDEIILLENEPVPFPVSATYFTKEIMAKISTMDTPSTIMGLCHKKDSNKLQGNKILILDDIQDPGNLGTIIRSAKAFNVDTIVLSENTVDLYNPKVLRATQGILFYMNIINREIEELVKELKKQHIPLYGTSVVNGINVKELLPEEKDKYALIMGNEGNGINSKLLSLCDKKLYIKMNNDVESLNVAIATSILLYELG